MKFKEPISFLMIIRTPPLLLEQNHISSWYSILSPRQPLLLYSNFFNLSQIQNILNTCRCFSPRFHHHFTWWIDLILITNATIYQHKFDEKEIGKKHCLHVREVVIQIYTIIYPFAIKWLEDAGVV